MNKYFYPLLFLLLYPGFVKSQQRLPAPTQKDSTIREEVLRHGKYSSILYTLNGGPITQKSLENLLQSYPAAALELNSYKIEKRANSTAIIVCTSIGFVSLLGAIIQSQNAQQSMGSDFSKAPVLFSLSIGSFLSELFFIKKNDHLRKAIEVYNSRL